MRMLGAVLVALLTSSAVASAEELAPPSVLVRAGIEKYKMLADETLKYFKAGDLATAKKRAKELEKAWDTTGKADLAKKQDLWKEIDTALDEFIDPILKEEKPDPAKVEAGYKDFVAKLNKAA